VPITFDFQQFLEDGARGRRTLSEAIRGMTASACGSIDAEALTESVLLEPRLIGWHFGPASRAVPIEQLLFRILPHDINREIEVGSGESGAITLPGIGSVETALPNARLRLSRRSGENAFDVRGPGGPVQCTFSERRNVPGTAIELIEEMDAVVKGFLSQNIGGHEQITIVRARRELMANLSRALILVEKHLPRIAELLRRSVQAILLFEHPTLNSFAALQMHGMIFLNVRRGATVLFFVDGLVHQGGHVVFSEATLERQMYFKVSPDESLQTITGRRDGRTAYEALHGLYTECALLEAFSGLGRADLDVSERQELAARTGFVLRRFRTDMRLMQEHAKAVLSHHGEPLFEYFAEKLRHFDTLAAPDTSDYSGHADDFDFSAFLKQNPGWQASRRSLIEEES